jgi:hypothetical protein
MLGWIIIFVVLVVVGIVLIIVSKKNYEDYTIPIVIAFFIALMIGLVFPILAFQNRQEVSVFNQQSAYIQSHNVVDPVENAAITNKKIELNDWLFKAQWAKEKFGIFSFYPPSVLDLKSIQ